ncbi:MAG: hypothetical protein LUD27_00625 [Clostridia bacterium]|nr:hypothetical protein [Clostridia bacterium]
MARIEALDMLDSAEGKAYLAELYGKVVENVQKNTISSKIKNIDLSGDPVSGTLVAKRFVNAKSQTYGTARTAGKGEAVKRDEVTIAIDQDKEIVEELEQKDVRLDGVDGVLERRANNHVQRMVAELDSAFFAEAYSAGTAFTSTETEITEILEALIQKLETTKTDFIDGVPRSMMNLVLAPSYYGKIRNALDVMHTAKIGAEDEEFYAWHGVKTDSCINLPDGVLAMVMINGAVAQPVMADQYTAEKIPLSNAYGVELFYHYGTEAVTPDGIYYIEEAGD